MALGIFLDRAEKLAGSCITGWSWILAQPVFERSQPCRSSLVGSCLLKVRQSDGSTEHAHAQIWFTGFSTRRLWQHTEVNTSEPKKRRTESLAMTSACRWLVLAGVLGIGLLGQSTWCVPRSSSPRVGHRTSSTHHRTGPSLSETNAGLSQPTGSVLALLLFVLSMVSIPLEAKARDGRISPPTCVAIIDAATNCPARPTVGAKKNAETQLQQAEARLQAAEKAAGQLIEKGQSEGGEPEMVDFWKNELQRLDLNQIYMKDLEQKLKADENIRLVGRLAVETSDVAAEEKFWCEAIGMQRYASLPGGGAVVAFGPPTVGGDEGGYFAIEIMPAKGTRGGGSTSQGKPRLSFVQVTTPALIRISRVIASGGVLVDGYGYYAVQSPAGVLVRAYVEDRRDPVELVAVAVENMQEASSFLQKLGLEARGPYKLVSPEMQAYMPPLPETNMLLGSGDPTLNTQVLLLPEEKEKAQSGFLGMGRGPALVINEDGSYGAGMLDEVERPLVPLSMAPSPKLTIYGTADEALSTET